MSCQVSVIAVNYFSALDLRVALEALARAAPGIALEIIVVDNSADPSEATALRRLPGITLLLNSENLGFARAANLGAGRARGEYLLFLNPDVAMHPDSLSTLLAAARACPEATILGPCLKRQDGTLQHSARRFYRPLTVLLRRTPLGRLWPRARALRQHLYLDAPAAGTRNVDWMVGACLLVSASDFLAHDGFDPRFFLYFEDVDLCLRAWRRGARVCYVGAAVATHTHRRASAGWSPTWTKWWHLSSLVKFLVKYRGWPRRHVFNSRRPVVFVNEALGVLSDRAARFGAALGARLLAKDAVARGRLLRVVGSVLTVLVHRPRSVHVIDVGAAGVAVAVAARVVGSRVILDTGDEYYELMRRTDEYRGPALEFAGAVERLALGLADVVAARGSGHVAALQSRGYNDVAWLPDGVDVRRADRARVAEGADAWRRERGWTAKLVAASVGSLIIDRRYGTTQGSELVAALPEAPGVMAAIVGDGPGRELLEAAARSNGCIDRIAFLGRVSPQDLARLLTTFDMCMWTQSNDAVGRARTTGKLPLFLAAGCFVLAADVGEATRVLPPEMRLPYHGEYDAGYSARLAARLRAIAAEPTVLAGGGRLIEVARRDFDYDTLVQRVVALHRGGQA